MDSNEKSLTTLERMAAGQMGTVVQIYGGRGFVNRLQALGIRPGKRVTKVSSMFLRGPITIQIDSAQFALSRGMARRILVELNTMGKR